VGLELVEITLKLEGEFAIDLGDDFWTTRAWDGCSEHWDVQVRDVLTAVEGVIREQHGDVLHGVYARLQNGPAVLSRSG
jgi:hypothetical protein